MSLMGYTNRVAWVDLTAGQVDYRPIAEEDALKYIGARGLGVKYVFDNGPQVVALSPDNILCFMNGPLTGTDANMSGRMAIVTKSPLTGTVTDSHHGGWSAARLKWAGFDGLVFKGMAATPVYAYIENGEVTLHDASDLWGKGVHETVKIMQERYGEPKTLSVIAIGPAGENLVRFGCWINENDRASGRGGTGCVGGSKHLKAVVIRGKYQDRPRPADKEAWKGAHDRAPPRSWTEKNVTSPARVASGLWHQRADEHQQHDGRVAGVQQQGDLLWRKWRVDQRRVGQGHILVNDPTCHACPVACKKEVEITSGPWLGCTWRA
ncbi:aldehyde ferredoxin oxidoreductase N-terminal domain-containing protein [Candidatus Amarobacter glycogenicus]|uniref:aldehyde ferredoxin oxidoreductase N-terminal domain-containing protein n=1 Tax=Candidatus Amarobacter glycogenicus TaxID=3140699 RepID=UPI0031CC92C9